MKRIPESTWAEVRTAYASGIGLREIARNLGVSENTVLSRAHREHWTRQIQSAKALAARPTESPTVTPADAAALSMQQRGERHVSRMAGIVERGTGHVEGMDGGGILDRIDEVEKLDKVARRTFGLSDDAPTVGVVLNLGFFSGEVR